MEPDVIPSPPAGGRGIIDARRPEERFSSSGKGPLHHALGAK
jgi:hypothetical protein